MDQMQDDEQAIRDRAYYSWKLEGCPEGRDEDFWERARLLQHSSGGASELTVADLARSASDDAGGEVQKENSTSIPTQGAGL